jgi:hypothetical protein
MTSSDRATSTERLSRLNLTILGMVILGGAAFHGIWHWFSPITLR